MKENSDEILSLSEARDVGQPWASFFSKYWHNKNQTVVFGHDAIRNFQKWPKAYGLDTGCCYGIQLTGISFPEETVKNVKAKRQYSKPKFD